MTYKEFVDKRQSELNALPIFFAFSNEQFKTAMEERGLTVNDTDKIYKFGDIGGFYLRSDADKIREYFSRPDELKELMKDIKFAEDAFEYEMANYEYAINYQGDWDVCSCFGNCKYDECKGYAQYLKNMGYSDEVIQAFRNAKMKHYKSMEENGVI